MKLDGKDEYLTFIVGPPGMGKSHLCRRFKPKGRSMFRDSDAIIAESMYIDRQKDMKNHEKLDFDSWWNAMNEINPLLFSHAQGLFLANTLNASRTDLKEENIIGYFPLVMLLEMVKNMNKEIKLNILFLKMDLDDLNSNTETRYHIEDDMAKARNNCNNVKAMKEQENNMLYMVSLMKENLIKDMNIYELDVNNENLAEKLGAITMGCTIKDSDYSLLTKRWLETEVYKKE